MNDALAQLHQRVQHTRLRALLALQNELCTGRGERRGYEMPGDSWTQPSKSKRYITESKCKYGHTETLHEERLVERLLQAGESVIEEQLALVGQSALAGEHALLLAAQQEQREQAAQLGAHYSLGME